MYWQNHAVALEQHADAQRRAEHERLIRALPAQPRTNKVLVPYRLLAAFGRLLSAAGIWLQAQAAPCEVAPSQAAPRRV